MFSSCEYVIANEPIAGASALGVEILRPWPTIGIFNTCKVNEVVASIFLDLGLRMAKPATRRTTWIFSSDREHGLMVQARRGDSTPTREKARKYRFPAKLLIDV